VTCDGSIERKFFQFFPLGRKSREQNRTEQNNDSDKNPTAKQQTANGKQLQQQTLTEYPPIEIITI
jgi:hypothetical protein